MVGYAFICFFICLVVWSFVRAALRRKWFRHYAQRTGLSYMGDEVPRILPLWNTPIPWSGYVSNTIWGDKGDKQLVIFDAKISQGKGGRSQTILAIRGLVEHFGVQRFDPSLLEVHVDEWTLIYRPMRLMTVEEIEALLSNI